MKHDAVTVIARDNGFLVVSPADGRWAEHADLAEAYRMLRAEGATAPAPAARVQSLRPLMPFFVKAATVALVGGFIALTASVGLAYALREAPAKAGQKAGRAVLQQFQENFVAQLRDTNPEQEEKIRRSLREAVPLLKPYAQELKPLFE